MNVVSQISFQAHRVYILFFLFFDVNKGGNHRPHYPFSFCNDIAITLRFCVAICGISNE